MEPEMDRNLPVDTEGTPVIIQCVIDGCESLDLDLFAPGAPGQWIFTCGAGHFAYISRNSDQKDQNHGT